LLITADNLDHVFKILLIGDAGVGKSSILLQFTDGYFNENLQSTIGVDFKVKVMEVASPDGKLKRVKVTIWDTGILLHQFDVVVPFQFL
jgi:Ras-related protein Rab-18